jgi:chemosensory pili system protein ChpA (sensor histidine kinase/response regulator)
MPAAAKAAAFTAADPEFLQLFVEEARENVTRLEQLFPQWEQNPLDAEALRDLRRAFHTLKGSGRMVGAQRVGEFSWSIESLLNRVISQTLARSPDIVSVVRDAAADRRDRRWRSGQHRHCRDHGQGGRTVGP